MIYHLGAPDTVQYEAAAIFMTLLAYPEHDGNERKMDRACIGIAHYFLRSNPNGSAAWLAQIGGKWPHIFPDIDCERATRGFARRLNDRMHAARMGFSFLQEQELGYEPKLPKAMKWLALNQWANVDVADGQRAGGEETGNLETRIWRPSLPVLHLAIAVQGQLAWLELQGREVNLWHFFLDEGLLKRTIIGAEIIAGEMSKLSRFKRTVEKRIQVVLR